jgi:hypothetical protein
VPIEEEEEEEEKEEEEEEEEEDSTFTDKCWSEDGLGRDRNMLMIVYVVF